MFMDRKRQPFSIFIVSLEQSREDVLYFHVNEMFDDSLLGQLLAFEDGKVLAGLCLEEEIKQDENLAECWNIGDTIIYQIGKFVPTYILKIFGEQFNYFVGVLDSKIDKAHHKCHRLRILLFF